MTKPDAEYRTTLQMRPHQGGRMLFVRRPSTRQRLLDYAVRSLWALALVVAVVAIFW